jgi:DNA-binding XRE family transcriptional regulator
MLKPLLRVPDINVVTFPQWLLLRRRELGVNQTELAEALGVSRTTISNWETGVSKPSLSIEQTKALCNLMQCTLEDLPSDPPKH